MYKIRRLMGNAGCLLMLTLFTSTQHHTKADRFATESCLA